MKMYWLVGCVLLLGAAACEETRVLAPEAEQAGATDTADGADGATSPMSGDATDAATDGTSGADETTATDGATESDGTVSTDGTTAADGESSTDATDAGDGQDGADGRDTTDGADGQAGVDGLDGVDETTGTDGGDGSDGTDGVTLPPLAPRTCTMVISYEPFGAAPGSVALAGEFNGWQPTATPMTDSDGDGTYDVSLDTTGLAGSYGYKFVLDGDNWILDPANPMRKSVDGFENSKLLVEDCNVPQFELESFEANSGQIHVVVAVRDGASESGLNPASALVVHGTSPASANAASYDAESQRFTVTLENPADGKHSLTFYISNAAGNARPLHLPIWIEDTPFKWEDAVLYFTMTDRFRDALPTVGGPLDCIPPNNANWQGGDWAGITEKIEEGYFDALGVNALWLTAVIDNPDTCMPGSLGKTYASYHGYFPSSQLTPENRLGTMTDLKALVDAAHARGIRVLVDLVANHLHSDHPLVGQKTPQGWFNGFFQCGFEEAPLTCWFETYLPDLNYENDAAVEEMTEAAIWWVREADLDGFRIDAVKHMHDNFLYTVRAKLEREIQTVPGVEFYTVGETFVGDWGGGSGPNESSLKKYINDQMLHGQFDFPMYWRILRVFARDEEPPTHVTDLLTQSAGYYGSQAIMSRFLGNHDVPRFISHAAGQIGDVWGNGAKELGWDNPPGAPGFSEPYQRLMLAWSFLFTVDGIPLIYYGDEIGLPGGGDPDNRRMMVWDGWTPNNQMVFDHVGALASIRKAHPALRVGTTEILHTDGSTMAYRRSHSSGDVVVVLNRGASTASVPVGLSGSWTDELAGGTYSGTVMVPPYGALILTQ